ncbi:hypothetical protein FHG89_30990 [Micromonospora orduensis]|uniref:RidA family protein n=1 Tax=Micromonospora orduensis TaxID=1420891 RepID=A0A5C4QA02_9ACTN|nr:Rid family hydrolase [Micromonospora orduensis]TNH21646.1 hypothetical protein FHG89_30990 [Micromonospora orduensis]
MPDPVALLHVPALSDVAEYAYAATVEPPARLVFTAGACPLDAEGRTVAPGDHAAQARQVLANLETALGVAALGYTDQLVEVEAVAAVRPGA